MKRADNMGECNSGKRQRRIPASHCIDQADAHHETEEPLDVEWIQCRCKIGANRIELNDSSGSESRS